MRSKLSLALLSMMALFLVACGGKDKVKNENAAVPGRDKELYEQAATKAQKGRYDEARLLYNVVITTYADSPYLPLAKLAIADSFYLEGGTSNLEQAIGGYKDFAQYFPTHPEVCKVKHKIAHSLMRQMGAYNRDASKAKQAEFQLKAALQSCQTSALKPAIENDLQDVQQVLGLHELDIARYYTNRQAYKAGESRLRDIITQYPFFSYYDESLYLLGVSLVEQEQPEEATEYFTKLVRDYPNSEYSKKGKDYLEKLGKPVPAPSNDSPAPERPGLMGRFGLILGRNGLDISRDGVLLSKSGDEKDDVRDATVKPSESSNVSGTRAIRASTKGNVVTPSAAAQATPAATAASPQTGAETKEGEAKKPEKEKKKKKKGILGGIFK
ncbi:MAG: outer membrane protein assembly factor BamD [Blastocatellia bacterium]|nr:outer membrane protein assembly factor BamD [Blastocatellia bacterium]